MSDAGGEEPAAWRRLHGRMLAVHAVKLVGALVPIAVVLTLGGGRIDRTLAITLVAVFGGAGFSAATDLLRWATTRYRVTGARIEARSGLLSRREQSIPRDRIRTVNVTAKLLHRLFGLATVEVGTGRAGQGKLTLDAVPAAEAARLRAELLARGEPVQPREETLARLRWGWLPYHLLSPLTLALPLIVLGGVFQAIDSFGADGIARDLTRDGVDRADDLPVVAAAALVLAIVVLIGVVAAAALFVESWWGYRLTREPGGTLHVRRGLLTSRSITIEQRRLRGVELTQPLLLRSAGGATLRAVVSGLKGSDDAKEARVDALLPAAPRGEAEQVAREVLRLGNAEPVGHGASPEAARIACPAGHARTSRPAEPADAARTARPAEPAAAEPFADLVPHPPAALRRRLVRGVAAAAAVVATLVAAGPALLDLLPGWAWLLGLLALVPALLLGRDAYRSLGHRLAGPLLITRQGTFVRRTVALERDGVIGWSVRRSPFQRRAGLVTLTATTAAGSGGYRVLDVDASEAVAFAEAATPGILGAFLHTHDGSDQRRSANATVQDSDR